MKLKQAAVSLIARWQEQEHIPEIICRLDEAAQACNPLDYAQIEQEFCKEEGIADTRIDCSLHSFTEGVRFAERMHGITDGYSEDN